MRTPEAILTELVDRLKASQGEAVEISVHELREWPAHSIKSLKSARLLLKARPASRLMCPGCEHQCYKPVELHPAEDMRAARAYIICDEPEDMGRISVDPAELEQWRIGDATPESVAQAMGVPLPIETTGAQPSRHAGRDAAIRAKYEELAQAGKRNYVKEIQRAVPGAESLSDRRIRDIVKSH